MKLIQLNMANGRLFPPLLRVLQREQADIICLQELEDTTEFDSYLLALKQASGLEHHFFSPLSGYNLQGTFYEVGDCILSRYPITDMQIVPLHGAYDPDWRIATPDYNNYRTLQVARIAIDKTVYHILNYYGYYVSGSKQGNADTMRIMDTICDQIDALLLAGEGHVIFASDANLTSGSPSMHRLNTTLRNLCDVHGIQTTRNFVAKRATEVIDYICVSTDLNVKSFKVADDVVSDHQMLILEI